MDFLKSFFNVFHNRQNQLKTENFLCGTLDAAQSFGTNLTFLTHWIPIDSEEKIGEMKSSVSTL